jgi:hypothetical protein
VEHAEIFKLLSGATAPAVYLFAAWYLAKKLNDSQERLIAMLGGVITDANAALREVRDVIKNCPTHHKK